MIFPEKNTNSFPGKTAGNGDIKAISVRAGSGNYLTVSLISVFTATLAFYLGWVFASLAILTTLLASFWLLAHFDRIVVDSRRITRTGFLPLIASYFTGEWRRLRFARIEQIETVAVQRYKRGGSVVYLYRMIISGENAQFVLVSNRRNFGDAIATIFAKVPEDVLDNRSIELRDHFAKRREVMLRVRASEIPAGDVLEDSMRSIRSFRGKLTDPKLNLSANDPVRAENLRRLANELRIAGFLVQALEAFRRASMLQPKNPWLLFEYARCMLSYAASERDKEIEHRAMAMMRLAEKRAGGDADLLSRLGEGYFHAGDWRRAGKVFKQASETVGSTFRSLRGQAELALREGKFAHVIHNFSAAHALANAPSLKRWTSSEIDYFSRLNSDEDYMELEIGRLNLMDTLQRLARSTLCILGVGIGVIFAGLLIGDSFVTDAGWAVSAIALLIWAAAKILNGILASRISVDTLNN